MMTQHGAVAQLGERRVRNAKVVGSNPIGSTILYSHLFLASPLRQGISRGRRSASPRVELPLNSTLRYPGHPACISARKTFPAIIIED